MNYYYLPTYQSASIDLINYEVPMYLTIRSTLCGSENLHTLRPGRRGALCGTQSTYHNRTYHTCPAPSSLLLPVFLRKNRNRRSESFKDNEI